MYPLASKVLSSIPGRIQVLPPHVPKVLCSTSWRVQLLYVQVRKVLSSHPDVYKCCSLRNQFHLPAENEYVP